MATGPRIADLQSVLVLGAGHGIGLALVEELLLRAPNARILAGYHRLENAGALLALRDPRITTKAVDPLNEESLSAFVAAVDSFDLALNAVGFLHDERYLPEKSLASLNLAQLQHTFAVNAFVTPLLAKALKPILVRERPTAFAALSAMVGSIGDNSLGGWHSYRASKTALNMFIKNIALEFSRSGLKQCAVLAIHPGTTDTELSRPFSQNVKHKIWSARESAAHILDTIEGARGSGLFLNWDGAELPW